METQWVASSVDSRARSHPGDLTVPPNAGLTTALDELEAALPQLIARYPAATDFWDAFATKTNTITDTASGGDAAAYAQNRLRSMLEVAGILPMKDDSMKDDSTVILQSA